MKTSLDKQVIAMRIAKELEDGECVNFGIGLGSLAAAFIPEGRDVIFHTEVGVIGYGPTLSLDDTGMMNFDLIDAGIHFVAPKLGMCFCDYAEAFDAVRVGRVSTSVLGAYQVSEKGDLASWTTDVMGKSGTIGGSMDIATGVKKVIVGMIHATKEGKPKIVRECTLPLTAKGVVDLIITDVAVIAVTKEGLLLKEVAPGWTAEDVQAITEPKLTIADDLKEIEL
jgi:acetate CoA/acetoacetate CoA-transferase beta subunit